MRSESMAEPKPAEPNIRALGDRDRHRRSLLSRSARRSIIHGDAAPGPHIGGVGRRSDNWETSAPDLTLEGRAGRYRAAARRSSAQRLKPLLQRAAARLAHVDGQAGGTRRSARGTRPRHKTRGVRCARRRGPPGTQCSGPRVEDPTLTARVGLRADIQYYREDDGHVLTGESSLRHGHERARDAQPTAQRAAGCCAQS